MINLVTNMDVCIDIFSDKECVSIFFFANRTLALKETANNTKHLNKNEKDIKILEKPSIFNI
jgi:hypothetical protein